jgi:tRNA (guanine37-N1)-methyltransferase
MGESFMSAAQALRVDCITLFPPMFAAVTQFGVVGRAHEQGRWALNLWNPRDFAEGHYRSVDDRPYGGGPGMVMQPEPLDKAITAARRAGEGRARVIYLSPQGRRLDDQRVRELSGLEQLILLCGRYEGVDQRLIDRSVDEEISIGDYVISGGELAAMVLIDAVVRQLEGVTHDARSPAEESFRTGLLDWPHYTRPEVYGDERVPSVLMQGNHAQIARWRLKQALGRTWLRRPELFEQRGLSQDESKLLGEFRAEYEAMKEHSR